MTTITRESCPAHRGHAGPLRRAGPDLRPGEPVLHRGLRGAARVGLPARRRARRARRLGPAPERGRCGCSSSSPTTHPRRRWRSTCTCTGPAWPPICAASATTGVRSSCRRPPTATSSPPVTARPATISACSPRPPRPSASTAAGSSTGARCSAACRPCGPTSGSTPWTRATPTAPKVIHGFLPRDASGYRIEQTWDALGMRATASNDTVFDGTFVPDELVPVVAPMGAAGADLFHLSLFAWGLLGFANVYIGAAQRAYDIVVESATQAWLDRAHPDRRPTTPRSSAAWPRCAWRSRRSTGTSAGLRRLVGRCRPRGRLAAQDRVGQALRRHPGVRGRRHGARPHRRLGAVQAQPHRAAVPGRAARPHPPGQPTASSTRSWARRRSAWTSTRCPGGGDRPVGTTSARRRKRPGSGHGPRDAGPMREDWADLNRRWWDERAPIHVASEFYDLRRLPRRPRRATTLRPFEIDEVGDVAGRTLVHPQCHFGLDTLSWARRGATVTGIDFSAPAVAAANDAAAASGSRPSSWPGTCTTPSSWSAGARSTSSTRASAPSTGCPTSSGGLG